MLYTVIKGCKRKYFSFDSCHSDHDGVTKKMSRHFFLYLCGFAGFLGKKRENSFTVDVQRVPSRNEQKSGVPA